MKRILTLITILSMAATSVFAQDNFKSHAYIQLQGGVANTVGETSYTKLFSPAFAASLGYHFTPVLSTRLNVSGFQGKGAIVLPSEVYKFYFIDNSLDLMFHLDNLFCNYKLDRIFMPYAFVGASVVYGLKNDIGDLGYDVMPCSQILWTGTTYMPGFRVGLGMNVRLYKNLAFNVELNENFLSDKFNGKRGTLLDFQYNALAGLTFSFGSRGTKGVCHKQVEKPAPVVVSTPVVKEEPKKDVIVVNAPVQAKKEEVIIRDVPLYKGVTENVFFLIRDWKISAQEAQKLDKVAQLLLKNPEAKVVVTGYADKETGTGKINLKLSQNRANAVAAYLVKAGVSSDRITVKALGDTVNPFSKPAQNRVAICVLN